MSGARLIAAGFAPTFSTAPPTTTVQTCHYVGGVLFVMANLIIFWFWAAFPLNNCIFTNGYPHWGQYPPPGPFQSSRYSLEWWTVWMEGLNLLLPYALAAALLNNVVPEMAKIHYWMARIFLIVNLVVFGILAYDWIFLCNWVPYTTMCNDGRYACVYFSSPEDAPWAPNTTPCVPNVASGQLGRSETFFQHFLFSLAFLVLCWFHRAINRELRSYGMFREVVVVEVQQQQ
jgi:hypothetical protein